MSLSSIIVHLDSGPRTAIRLDICVRLAERHGARLIGVFARLAPPHRVGVVGRWPSAEYQADAAASRMAFTAATAGLAAAEWIDLNRGAEPEVLGRFTLLARTADLVVLGQHDPEHAVPVPVDLVEHVVTEAGRPVLVVPFAGDFPSLGQRPFLAWHDGAQAARAAHDGLALLPAGAAVRVVSVARDGAPAPESVPYLLAHLAARGFAAIAEHLVTDDAGLMDALLARVADHGADLMMMGAFSGQGLPFLGRGSGTRFILRHMTVPVLLSH